MKLTNNGMDGRPRLIVYQIVVRSQRPERVQSALPMFDVAKGRRKKINVCGGPRGIQYAFSSRPSRDRGRDLVSKTGNSRLTGIGIRSRQLATVRLAVEVLVLRNTSTSL